MTCKESMCNNHKNVFETVKEALEPEEPKEPERPESSGALGVAGSALVFFYSLMQ